MNTAYEGLGTAAYICARSLVWFALRSALQRHTADKAASGLPHKADGAECCCLRVHVELARVPVDTHYPCLIRRQPSHIFAGEVDESLAVHHLRWPIADALVGRAGLEIRCCRQAGDPVHHLHGEFSRQQFLKVRTLQSADQLSGVPQGRFWNPGEFHMQCHPTVEFVYDVARQPSLPRYFQRRCESA